jgi:spermidine/putrescine-binding protein
VECAKKGVIIGANHKVPQGVPAWSDNATLTKEGGANKQDACYEFINETISLPWQARLVKDTGNTGTLSYDQAKEEGLTDKDLAVTLIPLTQEGDAFFEKMVFFQAVEDLDRRIEVWDEFKLGIGT